MFSRAAALSPSRATRSIASMPAAICQRSCQFSPGQFHNQPARCSGAGKSGRAVKRCRCCPGPVKKIDRVQRATTIVGQPLDQLFESRAAAHAYIADIVNRQSTGLIGYRIRRDRPSEICFRSAQSEIVPRLAVGWPRLMPPCNLPGLRPQSQSVVAGLLNHDETLHIRL